MKKILATILIAITLIVGTNVVPSRVFKAEIVHAAYTPWPGYLIKYAPSYYDPNVLKIQQKLNTLYDDTYCGTPDGFFGNQTLQAVKNFQWHVEITTDGVVGQVTWDKLFNSVY